MASKFAIVKDNFIKPKFHKKELTLTAEDFRRYWLNRAANLDQTATDESVWVHIANSLIFYGEFY